MNWVFLFLATAVNAQQFYVVNKEIPVANAMPLVPINDPNQIGVLRQGTVFEVLEQQALAVKIKLWIIQNQIRKEREYWLFKDSIDTQAFTEIEPIRTATDPIRPKVEASVPAADCTDGSCEEARITATTEPARENIQNLRAVPEQIKSDEKKSNSRLDEQIKNYSSSPETAAAIAYAMRNKKSRSTGLCYRAVKMALAAKPKGKRTGLIDGHFPDQAAINAKDSLKDHGFINLLEHDPYKQQLKDDPDSAPKGAVLVYSSGFRCRGTKIKDCGHVEIKTDDAGKPGYVSDYYSQTAVSETDRQRAMRNPNYKLVGIMIKPMDKK